MQLLTSNFEPLKTRFPRTLQKLLAVPENVSMAVELCANGAYALLFNGEKIYPYGKKDPQGLVNTWAKQLSLTQDSCNAVTGFGTGLHLRAILEVLKPGSMVMVGERDIAWLKWLFCRVDCGDILNDPRLFFVTDPTAEDSFHELVSCELVFKKDIRACYFSPLFTLDENYYYRFFTEFGRKFDLYKKVQSTAVGDSDRWQSNTFENLPYLLDAPDIGEARGLFKDFPMILVSAGPSLDEAIPFLKEAQERALIVSMNTSYRTLCKNGIRSHLTLAVDPRITTFDGFKNQPVEGTFLLTTDFVHPKVIQYFSPNIFTWHTPKALIQQINRKLNRSNGTRISAQGTVATAVGDLAFLLGCKRVCLVGQDLAITESGQTHTADSIYNDRGRLFMDISKCRVVPGNTLPKVHVESKLFVYLQFFNSMAKRFKDKINFINTARLGAKIEGIPYKSYEEALEFVGPKTSVSPLDLFKECFKFRTFNKDKAKASIKKALMPSYCMAERLLNLTFEGALIHELEDIPVSYEAASIKKAYKRADKINALIDGHLEDYQLIIDGKTTRTLFEYQKNLQILNPKEEKSPQQDWIKNREYYWALTEGSHFFVSQVESCFER